MKIRTGFVSNSSSSSFIIDKKHLTPEQYESIKRCTSDPECDWSIMESECALAGFSNETLYDLIDFMHFIGVDDRFINIGD